MCTLDRHQQKQQQRERSGVERSVCFSIVAIREYPLTLGSASAYSCSSSSSSSSSSPALPLTLSWEYTALPIQTLDEYEQAQAGRPRRSTRQMRMSAGRRRAILALREDVSQSDIEQVQHEVKKATERRRREQLWAQRCTSHAKTMLPRQRQQQKQRPSFPLRTEANEEWDACLDGPAKEGSAAIALLRRQAALSPGVPLSADRCRRARSKAIQRSFSSRAA